VVAVRVPRWEWAAFAPPCLLWSGEAALRLGRRDEARASLERVAALRSGAPADPLRNAAAKLVRELKEPARALP
jgi:hypothetical protein